MKHRKKLLGVGVAFFLLPAVVLAQKKSIDTTKTKEIEEVVVTALGIKREQKALGYSASKIGNEDLNRVSNQNILNSLSGKVAGVQVVASGGAPGQASRLVIRGGNKSITNGNEPLYVIDGIPITNVNDGNANTVIGIASPNRAADINPNDIEEVTVLKGAAGAVLYGNRGSNGVIIITTKSGKNRKGMPVVDYSTTISIDDALVLPDYQTVYAQGTNGATYAEGTSRSFGPRITGQTVNSVAYGASMGTTAMPITLKAYNPRKDFLKTGYSTNHNISVSQSTELSSLFLSAGLSNQESIVPNQGFRKANFRFNGNTKISNKFSVGVNASYNNSVGDMPFTGQDGNNPIFALFHVPVSWNLIGYGYQRPDNGKQINFRGGSFDNPLWSVYKNSAKTKSDRFITGFNLTYDVTNWFKINYRLGNDNLLDKRTIFRDIYTGGNPNGYLSFDDVRRNELTSTFMANFNKKIFEDFSITLVLGQDYNKRTSSNSVITGTELVLPGIANTNNIKTFDPGYRYDTKRTLFGIFGDFTLSYKNYLFLNLVGRNEWSSTLPSNNRSYFYPGLSTSFIFSDAFDISKNIVNYGKIRLGYSKTARDASPYLVYNTFGQGVFSDGFTTGITFPFNGLAGFTVSNTINNANLKPEFTTEYETGLEMKFLNDRLGFDFSYFQNKNTDGIIPLDISPTSGATQTIINSGETKANGMEVLLNITPIKSENFKWNLSFNFSKIKSKVVETYPGVNQIKLGGFDGNPAIYAVKGERYGSIIGSGYARNENGDILVDDDGYPLLEDGKNLGYVEPDWTGGLSTNFNYKGIFLSAQLDIRRGGYIYNGTEELLDFYGVTAKTLHREEDYIFPGINATTGQANDVVVKRNGTWYSGAYPNEEYIYKNNWVKLREIALGYNFKLPGINYVRNIELGIFGRNLALWSKIPHIDPESSAFGTGNAQGASRFNFPSTRTFGMSIKLQF